jgi:hypothetical protein
MNMYHVDDPYQSYYWKTTEDCLVEFHGFSRTSAIASTDGYRIRLDEAAKEAGPEWMEDLVFHQDPFNLACDLTGNDLPWDEHRTAYQRIMARNERLAGLLAYHSQAETIAALPEIRQSVNG